MKLPTASAVADFATHSTVLSTNKDVPAVYILRLPHNPSLSLKGRQPYLLTALARSARFNASLARFESILRNAYAAELATPTFSSYMSCEMRGTADSPREPHCAITWSALLRSLAFRLLRLRKAVGSDFSSQQPDTIISMAITDATSR